MVCGGNPFYLKFWVIGAKSPILNQLSLVAPQPYDLAKKFN